MTTTDCAETPATTTLWRLAARDTASLSAGIVPFGLMLGVTATAMHSGATATWLGALLIFGGSAQLTTLTLLHLGAGLLGAVVSGAVVNARLLLYGAAMGPRFAGQPQWFRLLAANLIQDQTYLSATGRPEIEGSAFRRYWGWLGGLLLGSWVLSVAVGLALGPLVPPLPHLPLVGTALFVAMLAPRLLARPAIAGAAAAASVAVVVNSLLPSLGIIAGAAAGLLVSLRVEGGRS
jgi:predicted branched-subunit amino acid permease